MCDTAVDSAVAVAGPNGFNSSAELVVVTHDITGALSTTSAAAIGHANSNYATGDTRLFVVDNGTDSAVYLFKSADANSTVSANELTLLTTPDNAASTGINDCIFGTCSHRRGNSAHPTGRVDPGQSVFRHKQSPSLRNG